MSSAGQLILVTGAAGFVGARVCTELLARGLAVRALVRRPGTIAPRPGLEALVVEDLATPPADLHWLSGVGAIIHLAGFAHRIDRSSSADTAEIRRANVESTAALARAAAAGGVRRLVCVSSIKVNGEDSGAGRYTAEDTPQPQDEYARSKLAAETALRRIADETGLEAVIVRPPLVYGPGVKANFLRLMTLVDRGVPLPFSSVHNRRSLIHVGNLAGALIACARHPAAAGRIWLVSDGEDVSTPELLRSIGRALGRPARQFPLPPAALRLAGAATGRSAEIRRLTGNLVVDSLPIRSELDWSPEFDLAQGLAETARWFRSFRTG